MITDQELVKQSNLIVKASFIGETVVKFQEHTAGRLFGVLKVDKTYKGAPKDIILLALPLRPANVFASSDIQYHVGQHGIWFLSLDKTVVEGVYLASHPQSFWAMDQQDKLFELLRYHLKK